MNETVLTQRTFLEGRLLERAHTKMTTEESMAINQVKIKHMEPVNNLHTHGVSDTDGKLDLLELLTFGFVREIEQQMQRRHNSSIVPVPLMWICVEFGKEARHAWFGIFDELHSAIDFKTHESEGTVDCQLLTGKGAQNVSADIVFLSNIGFRRGVHEVSMQCVCSHPNDKFGIVQNIDTDTLTDFGRIYLYNPVFERRYFWWLHTRKIWAQSSHHKAIENGLKWKAGDIVSMRVDCNAWTLQYSLNGLPVVKAFPIEENVTYYPVLTNGNANCTYHHLLPAACTCVHWL